MNEFFLLFWMATAFEDGFPRWPSDSSKKSRLLLALWNQKESLSDRVVVKPATSPPLAVCGDLADTQVVGATVLLLYVLYCRYTTSRYIQLRCCHLVRLQPSVEPVQFLAACTYCCSTILISKPLLCLPRDLAEEEEKNTKLKPDLLSVTPIF